jgi:predicted ABC-type ATPase
MPDRPPLAILVGGAPGSGKTTLAEALGLGLDLPVLHKDRLVHGRWRTLDKATDLGLSGVEPFFRSMELWIEAGISFVAEQTFYPNASESDVAKRLAPRSTLVNVHCRSVHSFERWEQR